MEKLELSDEARKKRNEYAREYRRRNPDKIRKYNTEYWERKAIEAARGSALDRAIKYNEEECVILKLYDEESIETRVYNLHEQGFSLRDIAAKVGFNHVRVSRILKSM